MKFSDSASWESTALVAGAAVAAILTTGIALKVFLKRTRRRFPQKWIKVGTLSKLTIFPIKSCRGVSVPEANVTKLGLHGKSIFIIFRSMRYITLEQTYECSCRK